LAIALAATASAQPPAKAPFTLLTTMPVPGKDAGGDFDHFAVDLKTNRLFVADEGHGTVQVYDMASNKHIKTIGEGEIHSPHSMLFRGDLHQLWVVDGEKTFGAVRIYNADTYALIKTIDVPPMSDWSGYDPATHNLWVSEIGIVQKKPDSTVQVIDTNTGTKIADFVVDDNVITDLSIDPTKNVLYTGLRTKNQIAVIDRGSHKVIATWPVSVAGCGLGHMAEDPDNDRLFVNCRSGVMLVYDTTTGKELTPVPVNEHTDELQYIKATKRLYTVASGAPKNGHPSIQVIQQLDPDHYKSLGEVATSAGARTGIYVPEKHRYYVGAPKAGDKAPQILVFQEK
jgi:DNA-binding beta-propeller fold protein YncE